MRQLIADENAVLKACEERCLELLEKNEPKHFSARFTTAQVLVLMQLAYLDGVRQTLRECNNNG